MQFVDGRQAVCKYKVHLDRGTTLLAVVSLIWRNGPGRVQRVFIPRVAQVWATSALPIDLPAPLPQRRARPSFCQTVPPQHHQRTQDLSAVHFEFVAGVFREYTSFEETKRVHAGTVLILFGALKPHPQPVATRPYEGHVWHCSLVHFEHLLRDTLRVKVGCNPHPHHRYRHLPVYKQQKTKQRAREIL